MIRKFLLASVGALALTGSAALAADLPSRAPPPVYLPPAPIFTWTGIYVGGQVGYAWTSGNNQFTGFDPFFDGGTFLSSSIGGTPSGVIGGGHVGYQVQLPQWSWFSSSGIVIGVEGSVDGTSINNTVFDPFSELAVRTQVPVEGSIRLRAGVAWDRLLVYATGGAAFTSIKDTYTDWTGFVTGVPLAYEAITKNRSGWTVGGGLQYAVTDNWSVGVEYRYSDFGHYTDYPFTIFTVGDVLTEQHHLTQNQVQVGLTYKFGSAAAAPVVAKY